VVLAMAGKLVFVVGPRGTTISLAEALVKAGHRVAPAGGVSQALHLMESLIPSLVLLNAETRAEVQAFVDGIGERALRVPFLLVSTDAEAGQWAREFGAIGFVPGVWPLLHGEQ